MKMWLVVERIWKSLRSTILSINEDKEWNRQPAVPKMSLSQWHLWCWRTGQSNHTVKKAEFQNIRAMRTRESSETTLKQLGKSKLGTSPRSSQVAQKSPCREIGGRWCPDFWGLYSRSRPEKDSVACLESPTARKASATTRNAWTSGRLIFVLTAWGHLNI